MRILIETVPHSAQRYDSVGDYFDAADGTMHIKVSDMGNDDYTFLVAIHELAEAWLCKKRGITDEMITGFDMAFEDARKDGDVSEPGDDPSAPYQNEHNFATSIERMMCAALGIKWADYESAALRLSQ